MPTLSPKLNHIPDTLMHHSEFWWSFIGAVIMLPVAAAVSSMAPNTVQFSCTVMSDSLQPHGMQHARLPWPSPTPGAYSNSCPLSHDAIQPSHSLSSPSSAVSLSQHQGLFQWVSSSHQVAKVLKFQLQHQSLQWIFRTNFLIYPLSAWQCCADSYLRQKL